MDILIASVNIQRQLVDNRKEIRQRAADEISSATNKMFQKEDLPDAFKVCENAASWTHSTMLTSTQTAYRRGGLVVLKAVTQGVPFPSQTQLLSDINESKAGKGIRALNSSKGFLCSIVDSTLAMYNDNDDIVRYSAGETLHEIIRKFHFQVISHRFAPLFKMLLQVIGDSPDGGRQNGTIEVSNFLKQVCSDASRLRGVVQLGGSHFSDDIFVEFMTGAFTSPHLNERTISWMLDWLGHVRDMSQSDLVVHMPSLAPHLFRILDFQDSKKEVINTLNRCLDDVDEYARKILEGGSEEISVVNGVMIEPPIDDKDGQNNCGPGNFSPKTSSEVCIAIIRALMLIAVDNCLNQSTVSRRMALRWIHRLVHIGNNKMFPILHKVVKVVLELLSSKDSESNKIAIKVNDDLQMLVLSASSDITDGAKLSSSAFHLNLRELLDSVIEMLKIGEEPTRLQSLAWITLINSIKQPPRKDNDNSATSDDNTHRVLSDDLFVDIVSTLHSASTDVLRASIHTLSAIAGEEKFGHFISSLFTELYSNSSTILLKAPSIMLQLQVLHQGKDLEHPERLFLKIAEILPTHGDRRFVSKVVLSLHSMLMTLKEMMPLRALLRQEDDFSSKSSISRDVFSKLLVCWAYEPVASIGLCLLSARFDQALDLVQDLGESEVTAHTLVQLDRLAQLIESPVFSFLRIGLLRPRRNAALVRALFGIQMILPRSSVPCEALHYRLRNAPTIAHLPGCANDAYVEPKPQQLLWWGPLLEKCRSVQKELTNAQWRSN